MIRVCRGLVYLVFLVLRVRLALRIQKFIVSINFRNMLAVISRSFSSLSLRSPLFQGTSVADTLGHLK